MTDLNNGHHPSTISQTWVKPSEPPELSDIPDGSVELVSGPASITTQEYKAQRGMKRDNTRKWLALAAVAHLFLLEGLTVVVLWGDTEALTSKLDLLSTTATGVTGIVLGFYFSQSED